MKKKFLILAVVGLVVCLIGFVAVASADHEGKDKDKGVKSKPGHLYLYKKCPPQVVPTDRPTNAHFCDPAPLFFPIPPLYEQNLNPVGRAWGKLEYKVSGPLFDFEFEGHHLTPGNNYTLIYFPQNFGVRFGSGLIYLGSGVAKGDGEVHINGSLATGNLPAPYDNTFFPDWNYNMNDLPGAKIWLVLSNDICIRNSLDSSPAMIEWNPNEYLFEETHITFPYTNADPALDEYCGSPYSL